MTGAIRWWLLVIAKLQVRVLPPRPGKPALGTLPQGGLCSWAGSGERESKD